MTRRASRARRASVGGSSGLAVVGALRTARELPADAVVVVLLPDHGRAYVSKIFNDDWMRERGFDVDTPATDPVRIPPYAELEEHVMTGNLARGFDSRAVHAGQAFDPTTGAVIPRCTSPRHMPRTA